MQRQVNPHIWPKPISQSIQLMTYLNSLPESLTLRYYDRRYIEYLMMVVKQKNISLAAFQLSLSIASRFLQFNSKYSQPIQLTLLVSLLIASKFLENENVSIITLHVVSKHSYTNRDIYRMQQRILQAINYDVLGEVIVDIKVKCILKIIQKILPENSAQIIIPLVEDIQILIWFYLHTSKNGVNHKIIPLLPYAIIQIALIFSTQHSGRFPVTIWMTGLANIKQQKLTSLVEELIKLLIGSDKFKQLQF